MNKKITLCLMVILLFLAACNSGGDEVEPPANEAVSASGEPSSENNESDVDEVVEQQEPPAPTETIIEPTATPVPTEVPEEVEDPADNENQKENQMEEELINVADVNFDVSAYQSYAYSFQFELFPEGSEAASQTMTMSGAFQVDPPAQQLSLIFADGVDPSAGGMMSITVVDGVSYSVISEMDGCISVPTEGDDFDNPFEDLQTDTEEFFGGFGKIRRVQPNETINGIEAAHYVFDETTFQEQDVSFQEVTGDVYVAIDSGLVVRLAMEGKDPTGLGFSEDSSSNDRFTYLFNVSQLGEQLDITLPEGCEVADGSSGFPKPEDASQVSSIGGIETFQTGMSGDEVAAFYQDLLPAEGWSYVEDESVAIGTLLTEVYTLESEKLQILIAPNGEIVTVTLVVEPVE